MKKLMIFISLLSFGFLSFSILDVKAQNVDVRELKYRDIVATYPSGNIYYSYLVFPSDYGNEDLVYRFENNMQSYFGSDTVTFTPTRSNIDQYNANYGYAIIDHSLQAVYDILDFDYIEMNNSTISFYLNNVVIYDTDLSDVYSIMHNYGSSVPDFPDFPNDPNDPEVPGVPIDPNDVTNIGNIRLLKHYINAAEDYAVYFDTDNGDVYNLNTLYNDLEYYYNTTKMTFLSPINTTYWLMDGNDNVIQMLDNFEYFELTDTTISFINNDNVIYEIQYNDVDHILLEYDENTINTAYTNGIIYAMGVYQDRVNDIEEITKGIADHYKAIGFNDGYRAGKQEYSDDYNRGYDDGANESFQSGIENWIVPAIIIVLLLGGFIAMNKMKRGEL